MRDIPAGNGTLLVNFDDKYQIRDIYFPHVGQENHSEGFPFRFGVWADGDFSWVFDDGWTRELLYLQDSLITDVRLNNTKLGISIVCHDMVAATENVYLRHVKVRDTTGADRELRVFLHHDFRINENKVGDTAYYDPATRSLIHYKKQRYFSINTLPHFDQFATGRKAFRDLQGTWRDAEDGELHGGAITEGSVDSTIAIHSSAGNFEFYYWIAAGTSHSEVCEINEKVLTRTPQTYFTQNRLFWTHWLAEISSDLSELEGPVADLYRRSLLVARTQIDHGGAIIAANDHDVTERATDHYSYLWPRDGAFVANAFDRAGYREESRRFFRLCERIVHERGYFLQKYNPDGTLGSGWHPHWDSRRRRELVPIQEDETALVLWALGEHHSTHQDDGFARDMYRGFVGKCADFLATFRDDSTGLPRPSWNLWEDRRGVHTFTCATVVAGLRAAASLASVCSDSASAGRYSNAADEIVIAMREHLYSRDLGRFYRGLLAADDDSLSPDPTVDASLFGIFYFGCFDVDDSAVAGTMQAVIDTLEHKAGYGGVARFENDGYMRTTDGVSGNSWPICTLWLAEYYIAAARSVDDLAPALAILEWVTQRALPSGVLAEQIDPLTGGPLSVSPLTWSHSTFVASVNSYLTKLRSLRAMG
jgi:glucoamylase